MRKLLLDQARRIVNDAPTAFDGTALGWARRDCVQIAEHLQQSKPGALDVLRTHDDGQRRRIAELEADNAILQAQLDRLSREALSAAQQGSVNVLNATLAGIEVGKREVVGIAGMGDREVRVLVVGKPGTGKTTIANEIRRRLDVLGYEGEDLATEELTVEELDRRRSALKMTGTRVNVVEVEAKP